MPKTPEEIMALYPDSVRLPDHSVWENRISIPGRPWRSRIRDVAADRIVLASNKSNGEWACSCVAWVTRKRCEHVDSATL